jgi:hypothetical protein
MLDAHPELAIGPETQFVPDLIELARGGASADELVDAMTAARTWNDFDLEADAVRARAAGGDLSAVLRAFYGLYAAAHGKPRWGEKTPAYVRRMEAIAGVLEESRFVHLIRDGRDVALSRRARGMGAGKPMAKAAGLWRKRIEAAREAAGRLRGRYVELRYEDLVADPERCLRRVCELIELDYDPAMLAYHEGAGERLAELGDLAPVDARAGREGTERIAAHSLAKQPPSGARTAAWRTEMSAEDEAAFEAVAGDLLRELGYDCLS